MQNRKGFSPVFVIMVIALIIVAGAVIWYFTSRQSTPSLSAISNPITPQSSSSATTSVTTTQNIATTTAAWKIYQNAQYGLTIKYPNDLYPQSIDSGDIQAGIFLDIESAPNGVAIGGAVPVGSPVATSGFAIVVAAAPYTSSSTFNINQYLANNGPRGQLTVPIMIGNIPGYEIVSFLPPDTSGNQPLAIIFHNGIVYQIGYGSTNYYPDFSDKQGFSDFDSILKNFTFTN